MMRCMPSDVCPTPVPPRAPFTYSEEELNEMPKCEPICPEYRPRSITVQLPPKLIMRRTMVDTKKLVNHSEVIKQTAINNVPTIIEKDKLVKVPVISWSLNIVKVPKVYWYRSYIPYPRIIRIPKVIIEPKEVCQTMLCQPKPQLIDIPPPDKFCCYEAGPQTLRCSQPCSPIPPPSYSPYPPCN